ncbi:MAG: hypothetical protein ACRC62_33205 [Microcoleus sp.]
MLDLGLLDLGLLELELLDLKLEDFEIGIIVELSIDYQLSGRVRGHLSTPNSQMQSGVIRVWGRTLLSTLNRASSRRSHYNSQLSTIDSPLSTIFLIQ